AGDPPHRGHQLPEALHGLRDPDRRRQRLDLFRDLGGLRPVRLGRVTFPTGDLRFDRPLVVLGDLGAFLADLLPPHTAAPPKMASGSPARSSRGSVKKDRCSIRKPTAEPAMAPGGLAMNPRPSRPSARPSIAQSSGC